MPVCPVCGFETLSDICPACGTALSSTSAPRERLTRPPAPKNQPALLHDASPVFTPTADTPISTAPIYHKQSRPADITLPAEKPVIKSDDVPEKKAKPPSPTKPVSSDKADNFQSVEKAAGFADAPPSVPPDIESEPEPSVLPLEDTDTLIGDENTLDEEQNTLDEQGVPESQIAEEAESASLTNDEEFPILCAPSADSADDHIPIDLHAALSIIRDVLLGKSASAVHCLLSAERSGWLWLVPLQLITAVFGLGLCGYIACDSAVFDKFGSSLGAAAIIWIEHYVILLILFGLLAGLTDKRLRFIELISITATALLPISIWAAAAILPALISPLLSAAMIIFGIIQTAFFLHSAADVIGITSARFGTELTQAVVLSDIIIIAVLIINII